VNYRFNIDEWLPRFPLAPRYASSYTADGITSPCHVCNNEQLRREVRGFVDWGPSVAVDLFIMAEGEPENRHATKIAGLPYRPAHLPWPIGEAGTPLLFLAQFNFVDSRDIVPDLPNDLLLVFVDGDGELQFEWQPLGLDDLTDGSELPPQDVPTLPCYGHILRTESFPDVPFLEEGLTVHGLRVENPYLLPQFQATQIGTAPFLIQEHLRTDPLPGRLLCTLNSVSPDLHSPYPFINRQEPLLPEGDWKNDLRYFTSDWRYFMLEDEGCIYISIDTSRQLHWRSCSY
jgi:hypothetical protein